MIIHLEHVRSFANKTDIPIRPLTLLVGENSSGKSTFLATVSAILDANRFPINPAFNDPPFSLGTFDTIATYKGGKYGRDESFCLGYSVVNSQSKIDRRVDATYNNIHGNPSLQRFCAKSAHGEIELDASESGFVGKVSLHSDNGRDYKAVRFNIPATARKLLSNFESIFHIIIGHEQGVPTDIAQLRALNRFLGQLRSPYEGSLSFAPIRSKPKRTYDEIEGAYSPEGDHIPSLLARLLREETSSEEGQLVEDALIKFGKESGLFRKLEVKKLGQKLTDPFQLRIAGVGPAVNLVDVGYGVSQSLPIVVQSVLQSTKQVLLMQQPEVHLHPRAQAALGSFFVDLVANQKRVALIETHSDFLVDRIRQEIADGAISKDSVSILFFDKPQLETTVSEITIDANGNIEDAPDTYRKFFLEEEMRLLKLGSK